MKRALFRKHNGLIVLSLVIILSIACLTGFFISSAKTSFDLADRFGNRNALNNITIKGTLNDSYHSIDFILESGKLSKESRYYDSSSEASAQNTYTEQFSHDVHASLDARIPKDAQTISHYIDVPAPEFSDKEHQVYERTVTTISDSVDFYCDLNYWPENRFPWSARFKADFYLKSSEKEFTFENRYYHGNPNMITSGNETFKNDLAEEVNVKYVTINGGYYVTFITNDLCQGQSGIYRVELSETIGGMDQVSRGKAAKLVNIDLENGKVKVQGLEAVQDKLVLLLLIDDRLVVRTYDVTGKLLGELQPDILSFTEGQMTYHPFIKDNHATFSLFYDKDTMIEAAIISLDVVPELKLAYQIKNVDIENGGYKIFLAADYSENSLVSVVGVYDKSINPAERYKNALRIYINIYGKDGNSAKLAYQGEFITDMADDYLTVPDPTVRFNSYDHFNARVLLITDIRQDERY